LWAAGVGTSRKYQEFDVIFVLPHMGRGGAQRVASLVANAWSQEGKRICIVTWDSKKEDAHELDPRILRIDMSTFTREVLHYDWSWRRWRLNAKHQSRQIERWLRARWPWRRWAPKRWRAAKTGEGGGSWIFPEWRPWWSSRRLRRMVARLALHLDRPETKESTLQNLSPVVRQSLARLVLGYRVDIFRELFFQLKAPVIMSLLTKTNLYVIEAARGLDVRVIISERNDPDLQKIDFELASLRSLSYRDAHTVTSNSVGILDKISAFVPANKLSLLPNPITVPAVQETDATRDLRFVTVARLVHQKGVDLLLTAFARIAAGLPGWTLEIVGDGPLLTTLKNQAETLGIGDRVTFHGHVPDPMPILQQCRIFVLPSRFEGMPNALLEAMAAGLAPVVTDASPGPTETISHERSGLIVATENADALADAMRRLAEDAELVERLAHQARAYVKEHEWAAVEPKWLEVLGVRTS
jgi:glycosyltransferase involved in cell wall biosynthesis